MITDRASTYTTELIKVAGIVSESIELLRIWQPGMRASQLRDLALKEGSLAKEDLRPSLGDGPLRIRPALPQGRSASRATSQASGGGQCSGIAPSATLLRLHSAHQWSLCGYRLQVLLGASRARCDGSPHARALLLSFINSKVGTTKLPRAWSANATNRVVSGLLKTFVDFGYAAQGRSVCLRLTPPRILPQTTAFVAYEARERGVSDSRIPQ